MRGYRAWPAIVLPVNTALIDKKSHVNVLFFGDNVSRTRAHLCAHFQSTANVPITSLQWPYLNYIDNERTTNKTQHIDMELDAAAVIARLFIGA